MILIDANVFMYAAGAPHPHRDPSGEYLAQVARGEHEVAIDAEIPQEILHRCRSINRWEQGNAIYDLVRTAVPRVIPITA